MNVNQIFYSIENLNKLSIQNDVKDKSKTLLRDETKITTQLPIYSQTCIQRQLSGRRQSGHIKQVVLKTRCP